MTRSLAYLFASLTMLPAAGRAQAPDGWLLASSFRWMGSQPCTVAGPGGLFYFDPRSGAMQPVTGLPADVAGTVPGSMWFHGPDFVLRIPDTNMLVMTGWGDGTIGQQMGMFVLRMQGSAVVASTRHDLGIVAPAAINGAGLAQALALADGRALCVVDPTCFQPSEPLSGTMLAVFDPLALPGSAGALTVVPTTPLPAGNPNALALDLPQGVVWVGVYTSAYGSRIYTVPWPLGGAPVLQYSFPGTLITALARESSGALLVAGFDSNTASLAASLWRIGPTAPIPFPQLAGLLNLENLRVDHVTGDLYLIAAPTCGTRALYRLSPPDPSTGILTQISTGPAGGWGVASGLDLDPDPETYGQRSGASTLDVQWTLAPNAGGLPLVGNTTFRLEMAAASPPSLIGVLLGFSRSSPPVFLPFPAVQILVVPVVSYLLVPGQVMPVPLPIPNIPSLVGLSVFGQGIYLDSVAAWGATRGVHLTVL